jgi:hypothetical protein
VAGTIKSMKNSNDTIRNRMKMSKSKSTSPSATQVKNRQKTISTDDKLEVLRKFEKGEQIVNICHNVVMLI